MWHSAGRSPLASRGITSGRSAKRDVPVSRASKAGSRSRSSAIASRSAARAPRAPGRGDGADLAGADREPPGVERAAERELDLGVAVPAEVEDGALGPEQVERRLQPGRGGAGVHDQVAAVVGVLGRAKPTPSASATAARAGSTSTRVTLDRRQPRQQPRDAATDHPRTHHRDPVADHRAGVPERVDGGLDGPGEHGAARRHVVGHDGDRARRDDVRRLVGVERRTPCGRAARAVPPRPARR